MSRVFGLDTPLHIAARNGDVDKVRELLEGGMYGVECPDEFGRTPLHVAARGGHLGVVRVLISEYKASMNAFDNYGRTPFLSAIDYDKEDVALALLEEFNCKVSRDDVHRACKRGLLKLVQAMVQKCGVDIMNDVYNGDTPLHAAARSGNYELVMVLLNEYGRCCDTLKKGQYGQSLLHCACEGGNIDLVQTIIRDHRGDITARDDSGDTPLHLVARSGNYELAMFLLNEYGRCCDTLKEGNHGQPLLHCACEGGNIDLVRTIIRDYKGDVMARDGRSDTPLHIAAWYGREDLVCVLIDEYGCDVNVRGCFSRSLLHSACVSGNGSLVRFVSQHISRLVVDDNGDTPLHLCAQYGKAESAKVLLKLDQYPPLRIRNHKGKTPMSVASEHISSDVLVLIDDYIRDTGKIYSQSYYESILRYAKRKYSIPEPITRAFVLGNLGAGKSSLVEALKREGFFDSFKRVSESSVPPHTAGIVPSIHTSKHYGRVLFYDFAGSAEYYSSHAAILENLASSRKGDNVFLVVIDMREEMAEIKKTFHYWLSFIQHQQFRGQKPRLIVVGSHSDLLTEDVAKARGKEFQMFYDRIDTEAVQLSPLFMVDCCKPRSKKIAEIQTLMNQLTKDSPRFKLSPQASTLLGLLEKDFSNVAVFSMQDLLSHIDQTGIELQTDTQFLRLVLLELHDLGLLFLIDSSNRESSSVVLNMSQLTSIAHKSLFSEEAVLEASFEKEGLSFSFRAGIIPQSILAKILPVYITKECLVQLQYCQEISHAEAYVFPSLKVSDSTDKSFLFFPALCSADKNKVEWVTPPDLSYGIGWLARCTDPCDYLSPRFHHVLMLRLVFKFTLSAHPPADQVSSGSPDLSHFQRRCTVWKTGVHWLMKEGVECMVELAGANREVVVHTKSTKDRAENCATVFNDIVSCVMEAKAEFCHSVRLEFFLLDSTSEAEYHSADNLFAMRDVERVLTSADGRAEVVVSASGRKQLERSKLLYLHNFTLWSSLFPMDFKSVLHCIKDVVRELYTLGLHLDIPRGVLDCIEAALDAHCVTDKERRQLVKGWMSSSLDPPCWWHLVEALHAAERGTLAQKIAKDFGK